MIVLCAAYGFVQSVSRLPIAISADQRDRKSTHSSRARSATAASCSPGAVLRGNGGSPANGFQPALHTTGDTEGHDREAQQGASGIDLPQGRQRRTSMLLAENHLTLAAVWKHAAEDRGAARSLAAFCCSMRFRAGVRQFRYSVASAFEPPAK